MTRTQNGRATLTEGEGEWRSRLNGFADPSRGPAPTLHFASVDVAAVVEFVTGGATAGRVSGLVVAVPEECGGQKCTHSFGFGPGKDSTSAPFFGLAVGKAAQFATADGGFRVVVCRSGEGEFSFVGVPTSTEAMERNSVRRLEVVWRVKGPLKAPLPAMTFDVRLQTGKAETSASRPN